MPRRPFRAPPAIFRVMCGPGIDGSVIETGNRTRGLLFCETYDNPSYTITPTDKGIIIFAIESITIAGVMRANGTGAAGGAGGISNPAEQSQKYGGAGEDGEVGGAGGDGGEASTGSTKGAGGINTVVEVAFNHYLYEPIWRMVAQSCLAGAGGGGGGARWDSGFTYGHGGKGGDGGGFVVLFAPVVTITGTIEAKGEAGGNGGDQAGGGGGGGGGFIWVIANNITDTLATYTRTGGAKGAGGANDGVDGNDGILKKVIVPA